MKYLEVLDGDSHVIAVEAVEDVTAEIEFYLRLGFELSDLLPPGELAARRRERMEVEREEGDLP